MKIKTKELTENRLVLQRKRRRDFRANLSLFMLTLPMLVLLILFHFIPIPGNLVAFKDYVPRLGIFKSEWSGFDNFKFIFQSQDLARILRNTILYSLWFLLVDFVMGPMFAVFMFHLKSRRAGNVYKTIMQIPRFFSYVIVGYLTYIFLSPAYGVANQIIQAFGGEAIEWYREPGGWPIILTVVRQWVGIGGGFLIYYSILLGIDSELFDAARIDGAGTLKKVWYIAIPEMMPLLCMNLIFGVGGILGSNMDLHHVITRNSGYLFETTDVLSTYLYRGLMGGQFERSAAVGLMTSLVGMILLLIANGIVRKLSPENAMF